MLYGVIKTYNYDYDIETIDYLTFDREDAERVAKGQWGDDVETFYEVIDIDSASMSKELFDLIYPYYKEKYIKGDEK